MLYASFMRVVNYVIKCVLILPTTNSGKQTPPTGQTAAALPPLAVCRWVQHLLHLGEGLHVAAPLSSPPAWQTTARWQAADPMSSPPARWFPPVCLLSFLLLSVQ